MKRLLLLFTICISSVSFGQVPSYVPTDSLVGYWGFNGNADDESGNGNNGTVNGATLTTDRFGYSNSAYDFDGMNDLISLSSNYDPAERTITAWFSLDLYSNLRQCILNNDYPQLINGHTIFTVLANDSLNLQSGNAGSITSPPVLNQWYFVCVTRNDSTRYFIDGQLVLTTVNATLNSISAVSQNLRLGVSRDNNLFFNGKIDDVGVWNRALDSCEVKDLYEGSLGNCCVPDPITSQPTDVTVPLNGSGMFSTSTSVTSPTYQWQMDNGTGYMDLTNAGQFSGVDTDMLTVSNVTLGQNNTLFRCILTENSNCSDTTDVAVLTVEDNTGLEELNQQISIFPNPTSTSFKITSKNSINSSFKLMDIQGKVVLTGKIDSTEETVDISKLSKGQYNLVFDDESISPISIIKN